MPRRGSYLYKQNGSQNWYLRLQYPPELAAKHGRKKLEKSLGTPARAEAEALAADEIANHKKELFLERHKDHGLQWLVERGGAVSIRDRNFEAIKLSGQDEVLPKPNKAKDEAVIETWIQHKSIAPYIAKEARENLATFKRLVNDKPLSSCNRDDGRKLVAHFKEQGNKTKTISKKVGYLAAAINLAIKEGKLTFNPFASVVPKDKDGIERGPLYDDDMAKVRDHLHQLSEPDQLLWKWLAMTGMRLSEPFEITSELQDNGVRYVIVGTKNAQSRRRVPIPPALFPMLPAKINGRLFPDKSETAAKRLRYFLKRLGISHDSAKGTGDPRKTVHSLRHRAKDRLRAAQCPLDIQYHILGHEELTVAQGYGHGYPMDVLLPWVEKIGF